VLLRPLANSFCELKSETRSECAHAVVGGTVSQGAA